MRVVSCHVWKEVDDGVAAGQLNGLLVTHVEEVCGCELVGELGMET